MSYDWAFNDEEMGRPRRLGDNVWIIGQGRTYKLEGEDAEEEDYDDDLWDDDLDEDGEPW